MPDPSCLAVGDGGPWGSAAFADPEHARPGEHIFVRWTEPIPGRPLLRVCTPLGEWLVPTTEFYMGKWITVRRWNLPGLPCGVSHLSFTFDRPEPDYQLGRDGDITVSDFPSDSGM